LNNFSADDPQATVPADDPQETAAHDNGRLSDWVRPRWSMLCYCILLAYICLVCLCVFCLFVCLLLLTAFCRLFMLPLPLSPDLLLLLVVADISFYCCFYCCLAACCLLLAASFLSPDAWRCCCFCCFYSCCCCIVRVSLTGFLADFIDAVRRCWSCREIAQVVHQLRGEPNSRRCRLPSP